jgi:asparagine synthase (glutamine-hydrolysing)
MPGIFGILDKRDESAVPGDDRPSLALTKMAGAMTYEPFYSREERRFARLGLGVGWAGPKITPSSGPILDRDSAISLFATGEPYCNSGAAGSGVRVPADDLRGVIRAYRESPDTFPAAISGLFSGIVVDEGRGRSLLFTDRLGMERVFVYEDAEIFVFASEAKGILAAVSHTRQLDPDGLAEFLISGCTFGERSLFRAVRVMPAGTVLELVKGRPPRARRYFDRASWENLTPLPEAEFLAELGGVLETTTRKQTAAPPAVAISLTGGLDSRMIMASLNVPSGTLPCYTFGSMYRDTYDVRVGRRVASQCGQPHHVLVLGEPFVGASPDYLEKAVFISDGYLGLSGAAELYLNGLARRVAPIRITGNYGGEMLRGFRAFNSSRPRGGFLSGDLARRVDEAANAFMAMDEVNPLSFTLFRQAPSGYGRYAIERSQVTVRSPFLDDQVAKLLYRRPASLNGNDQSTFLIARRRPDLLSIATDRGLLGRGGPVAKKIRRIHREVLFKGEYLTGHGAPHWMAALTRRNPGRLLERSFIGRHKFLHPRRWVRDGLSDYVRETLLGSDSNGLAPYVDLTRVKTMFEEHVAGERNYWEELDRLLTIALASRVLLRPEIRRREPSSGGA